MHLKSLAMAVALALPLSQAAVSAQAQEVVLRYSNWLPPGFHLVDKVMKPWIEQVEKVTEGRVTVQMLPKVVGTVNGQYDVLAEGLADLSLWCPCYSPGRFPLVEGLELPFLGDDPIKLSTASWNIYEKYLADTDAFKDIKVVGFFASNPGQVLTVEKTVTGADDFDGLRLRSPSPVATEILTMLGAVPVPKPMTELYEMAAGGIVDGAVMPIDPMLPFKLDDVFTKINLIEGGIYNTMMVVGINPAKWDQISEADRKAIEEISGAHLAELNGQVLQEVIDNTLKVAAEKGITIEKSSPEETAELKRILKPIWDAWIEKAKAEGLENPQAMLEDLTQQTGGGLGL